MGEPRVGHEGDEGLARVPEKLAAKGGPAHAAPPHGLVERERLGKTIEDPLHHAVHPRPGGVVFHGGHARLTERHGVRVLRVLEQGQQFQEQSRTGQFAVRRHAVEQGEGGRGDGGAEAQAVTGGAGQPPHLVAPAELVEHEVGRQVELQGESGGAALFHPAVRQVAADEDAVHVGERLHVIADVAEPGPPRDDGKLELRVAVPAAAHAGLRRYPAAGLQGQRNPGVPVPAQQAQEFPWGEADALEQDSHGP